MLGYNVFVMYLRAIGSFLLALKNIWKNITLGGPHLSEGGGHEKCAPGPLFFGFFLTLPLGKGLKCIKSGQGVQSSLSPSHVDKEWTFQYPL